ncbi:hypothetical protein N0V84_001838 [Fusarium piperis]|uniref:Uncharacterized protein n=1 Tax=Fusarium piperis TaxID=1435070 RepID=A0A9W8WKI1_9HYPO|nr:hypothetical protein N0V84_001838 [Fusarium piperis]
MEMTLESESGSGSITHLHNSESINHFRKLESESESESVARFHTDPLDMFSGRVGRPGLIHRTIR